jgi:hypothetical protein
MSSSHRAGKGPRMAPSGAGGQPLQSPTRNTVAAGASRSPSLILTSTTNSAITNSSSSNSRATLQQRQQQQAATNEHQPHQQQEGFQTTTNNINNDKDYSMLLRLSNACKKHQAWHKENPDDTFRFPCIHVENTPEKCQRELDILRKVLFKLEQEYQAAATTTVSTSATPEHVGHMCDFYRDALAGGFCPHAPHLFQLGRGAMDSTLFIISIIFLWSYTTEKCLTHHLSGQFSSSSSSSSSSFSHATDSLFVSTCRFEIHHFQYHRHHSSCQ